MAAAGEIVKAIAGVAVFIWIASKMDGCSSSNAPPSTASQQSHDFVGNAIEAQLLCKKAILKIAKNPSTATIPYASNQASAGGYFFHWAKGDGLVLQNAYGAKLDTEVTCIAKDGPLRIVSLIVDGKRIIEDKSAKTKKKAPAKA